MERDSSQDEFAELRAFALALAQFLNERHRAAGGLSYAEALAEGFDKSEKQVKLLRKDGRIMCA